MKNKAKAQNTIEYVLLFGAIVLAIVAMLGKSGIAQRIAKVYDSSGQVMSSKVGKTNRGESLVGAVNKKVK